MIHTLPPPRTPDSLSGPVMRWGILGPGWIAERFVSSLRKHTDQQIVSVGSRSQERGLDFARRWEIPAVHASYEALLADRNVDIVYVGTPHVRHHECALAALSAGKHVLVEKPLGINAVEAADIVAAADTAGLFVGEAMWTKFLPKFDVIRQLLDDGVLGTLHTVVVDNGEHFTTDHRIYDPGLLGGPMLDMGIYPLSFAHWTLGDVDDLHAFGQPANSSVNGQFSAILRHVAGGHSTVNTTILTDTPRHAFIAGCGGYVSLPGPHYQPGPFTLVQRHGESFTYDDGLHGHIDGLHFAAVEAAKIVADGGTQSLAHPHNDAIATLRTMDRVRNEIGLVYPQDLVGDRSDGSSAAYA